MKKASLIFNLLKYYKILFFTSKIVFSQIITTRNFGNRSRLQIVLDQELKKSA